MSFLVLTSDLIDAEVTARAEAQARIAAVPPVLRASPLADSPSPLAEAAETALEKRLAEHGIRHPELTIAAARRAGLALQYACACVVKETSGGWNEVGNDPGNPINGSNHRWVTREVYEAMVKYVEEGYPSQGMGPTQLTSRGLQEEADKYGGCWTIGANSFIGFVFLRQLIHEYGVEGGAQHFNGSGPAAVAYGKDFVKIAQEFVPVIEG